MLHEKTFFWHIRILITYSVGTNFILLSNKLLFQYARHDYGLFVIKFAEYVINGKIDTMGHRFDPRKSKFSLACQLYKHGCEKIIEAYETDFDLAPRTVKRDRKIKGLVIQ